MISVSGASWRELCRVAEKCGFSLREGAKHTTVRDSAGQKITSIPRHSRLKKPTALGVIKSLKKAGCQRKEIQHIK